MHVTGLPSLTAVAVAGARVAGRLSPWSVAGRSVRALSGGFVEHVTLRGAAIDAALRTTLAADGQLVLLGAGLDLRAVSMPELSGVEIYEIDHPATQGFKRALSARGLRRRARAVRFVGVDFEVDDLGECLERAGHDASRPTFWLWEGVTMYLTEAAIHGTLGVLSSRSSRGSVLATTYGTPEMIRGSEPHLRLLGPLLHVIGEPFVGLFDPATMAELVRAYGFVVAEDSGSTEWASRAHLPLPKKEYGERLLVARYEGGAP